MNVRTQNIREAEVSVLTIHKELCAIQNHQRVHLKKVFSKVILKNFKGSCADFGSSGSGIVREWKEYKNTASFDFPQEKDRFYQYSFVGPLSMSKGCDLSLNIVPKDYKPELDNVEFIYRGNF